MDTYKVVNRLSGPLRIRLPNGEFIMLKPGEPMLLKEYEVEGVKGHPMIEVVKIVESQNKLEYRRKGKRVRK